MGSSGIFASISVGNSPDEHGQTADLIMQNASRFFVDNAREKADFTYAGVAERDYEKYLAEHPVTREILDSMTAPRGSVLTSTYWAILPFQLGGQIIKYRLEPDTSPEDVPDDAPDYLAIDLANRLARREYRFTLAVQVRVDPATGRPRSRSAVGAPMTRGSRCVS